MNLGKIIKAGMIGGLAGAAAKAGGVGTNDLARNGFFGLSGLMLAKKKKRATEATQVGQRGAGDIMAGRPGSPTDRGENTREFKKGGKVKKKPMVAKKMAAGGSTASKRADGCATKGKTKGRFI